MAAMAGFPGDLDVQLEEPGVAISALRQVAPLALATDAPTGRQGSPLLSWSTAEVDPKDRFDYWRTVRAKGLFGATAELEPERRPGSPVNFRSERSARPA